MIALVLFGIVVLVCAEEVIRLARDARADMDEEGNRDVFARRRQSGRVLLRRTRTALRAGLSTVDAKLRGLIHAERTRRAESPTVRLVRPNRDLPTVPAIARR
ncbi:MAG TPA: hypothetical protein VG756_31325 [Pseudonocardiaceae bacterium]|nr:hypothetical protein [Pseudonocardiaceae bacterium]